VNATPWADLSVDGVPVGEAPRTVRLPAGRHRLRVRHPTYGQQETVIEVRAGERSTWTSGLMR
jgi:serine/threonine-protein kinase